MDPDGELTRRWMRQALTLAERARLEGEVPVGALVLRDGRVLGRGWNRTEQGHDPSAHAELIALRRAAARERNYRLPGTTLVSTLEPCLMCFGAILEARVETVLFGAADPARGAVGIWKSGQLAGYPVQGPRIEGGIEEEECRKLLQHYFQHKRRE